MSMMLDPLSVGLLLSAMIERDRLRLELQKAAAQLATHAAVEEPPPVTKPKPRRRAAK